MRFIQMPENARKVPQWAQSIGRDKMRLQSATAQHRLDVESLVDQSTIALRHTGEDGREGMERRGEPIRELPRFADDRGRVQSTAQRRADWHRTAEPRLN